MKMEMMSVSDLYVEITKGTYHSPAFLKQIKDVTFDSNRGFRSVYFFGQEAVDIIMKRNSVSGIDSCPVYSDTLFVDFDDGDESIPMLESILKHQNIAYEIWFSGRKGFHFHVPIEPMWGSSVPYSQKMWVESTGIKTADLSIYKHTGLIRLPHTIHDVTGVKKHLVRSAKGSQLIIPLIQKQIEHFEIEDFGGSNLAKSLTVALHALADEPVQGKRHSTLVAVAKLMIEAGMSPTATREFIGAINETWVNQKSEDELDNCIQRVLRWIKHDSCS